MSKILAIVEAIKTVGGILSALSRLYKAWQDKQIDKHYEAKQRRVSDLSKQLQIEVEKESPSDEAIKELHRKLRNLGSDK